MELIGLDTKDLSYSGSGEIQFMATDVKHFLPEVDRAAIHFSKTQSQFMDNVLTVNHPTPIRNLRQIMAEITKAREALREAKYNVEKKKLEAKKFGALADDLKLDAIDRELNALERAKRLSDIEAMRPYIEGSIRKIRALMDSYASIKKQYGIDKYSEADFEREEEEYHIKKAFDQALTAARSRGGNIDEGNHIYLNQLGLNGAVAQALISNHLAWEQNEMKAGRLPSGEAVTAFLNHCYKCLRGQTANRLASRGMSASTDKAMRT